MTTIREASGYVSIQQAMELARVSRRTIYNWITQGKVRAVRTAGGRQRIDPASLFAVTPHDTLRAGTIVHVEGRPVRLQADAPVDGPAH